MAWWREPAVANPPPRTRCDVLLAAAVLIVTAIEVLVRHDLAWPPAAATLGVLLATAVVIRRSHRLAAIALAFGGFAIVDAAALLAAAPPVVLYSGAVVLVPLYALWRWGSGREIMLGLGVIGLGVGASIASDGAGVTDALGGVAVVACTAAAGVTARFRSAAREHLVEQARLHEREELARELHDTVAHHVSAIAIQAQAGLFLARSGALADATQALEVIDREAARTLTEMRDLVGALRDHHTQPSLAPPRGVADLARLATDGSTDGVTSQPPRLVVRLDGALTDLTPRVDAALYRIAQESITNARRHARQATRIEVTVTGGPTRIELTIEDDGTRVAAPGSGLTATGFGLVGMAERARLLGGTLSAGPKPDGGWRVQAVIARSGSPA